MNSSFFERLKWATSGVIATAATIVTVMVIVYPQAPLLQVQAQAPIVVNEEQAVIAAAAKARPAVVSIVVSKTVNVSPNMFVFPNDFLNNPFQQPVPQGRSQQQLQQVGSGTGFVVDSNGLIVTNKHVAGDKTASYQVILNDGRSFTGTIVAMDPANDIAVLKIPATGLPTIALGNSDAIVVGQTAIAIGNSLGRYQNTVTRGVVSGMGRTVVASDTAGASEELSDIIQTDAAINPGNSGGPLLDSRGQAIGINTAVDQQGQGIGFAIPINTVKDDVAAVEKTGTIQRPWIGMRFMVVTPQLQKQLGLPVKQGALLTQGADASEPAIIPNSPAAQAGLKEGDIVQKIDGQTITKSEDIQKVLNRHKVGDSVHIDFSRSGKAMSMDIKLGATPNS